MDKPIPKNVKYPQLYRKARESVYKKYTSPSAYRSGALVKEYKKLSMCAHGDNGYISTKKGNTGIKRWFAEEWINMEKYIKDNKVVPCGRQVSTNPEKYPACRPRRRITAETPLTADEMLERYGKKKTLELIKKKQKVKSSQNVRWKEK